MKIPRRIIQTGKSAVLPLASRAAVANIRLLNPDYEYCFFDDAQVEAFIDAHFPEYRSVVDAFPIRIQRYDFFRYLAVYHLGGFYFDLDVYLASGLDDLLDFGCVLSFEELTVQPYFRREKSIDWEVANYAFGAAPGHPFLGAVIRNCVMGQQDPAWVAPMLAPIPSWFRDDFYVFNTTGPGLVTRTLAEYPDARRDVKVLFPEDVLDESAWHCFGTYGVHLQDGTWRTRKGRFHRKLRSLWEVRARRHCMAQSRRLGTTRTMT